jgi:hypothetical protein
MTNEAVLRQLAAKENLARREGIRSIIMDFRFFLNQLGIIQLNASQFNSGDFMDKYSPLYKKTV